jgi:predicted outer membrane protein
MKNTPILPLSVLRAAPWLAAGLIATSLTVSIASAQSSAAASTGAGASTSDRTATGSSTSPNSDRAVSTMPSAGSSTGSGTNGSYGSSSSASTGGSATATNGSSYGTAEHAGVAADSREYNGSASTLKRGDKRFITKAVECSDRELAASQLAAQRASDPQIRSFAQQVASEHQRMQQELVQLAQSKGVKLDHMENMGLGGLSGQSSASVGMRGTNTGITASSDTANISGVVNDHGSPRAGAVGGVEGSATIPNFDGAVSDLNTDRHVRNLSRKSGAEFDRDYVDLMVDSHEDAVRLFQRAAKDAKDADVRSYASAHLAALQAHLNQANLLMKSAAE